MIDIGIILENWPYDPEKVNVRRIKGADGKEKYQMRLALGMLQMEISGRPDGLKPEGFESYLELFENRLEDHRRETGSADGFSLSTQDCRKLRTEAAMYYHRYLAAFLLDDYEITCRDTHRNLRTFDFLNTYGAEKKDRISCEGYRPYVLRMNASARAQLDVQKKDLSHGIAVLNQTIEQIKDFYKKHEMEDEIESSRDIDILRVMSIDIQNMVPDDDNRQLKKQIKKALQDERYEDAADLRDRLKRRSSEMG